MSDTQSSFLRVKFWIKRHPWLYFVASCPYAAPYWDRKIRRLLTQWGSAARVLDLGAGERKRAPNVLNLEIAAVPHADVVGDGHALPFAD
ncbi:MAG: hypothetical protein ABGY41_09850, partial [Candidatus Poribacteria bacterium]